MDIDNRRGVSSSLNSRANEPNLLELFPDTYRDLQRIAHFQMQRAWQVDTIQTTALVNEAFLKLHKQSPLEIENKQHFFAICAKAMRQILLNYAEQKQALKRGGEMQQVTFTEGQMVGEHIQGPGWENLLNLERALSQLEEVDEHLAQLVELRYFVGATEAEMAEIIGVSDRTIRRDWIKAKALLAQALEP